MLDEVYQIHAPSITGYEERKTHEEHLIKFGQAVIDSGKFKGLVSEQLTPQLTYSIDNYIALLSTLSPYIRLETQNRDALFKGLRETLDRNCISSLEISYLSVFHVAQKI